MKKLDKEQEEAVLTLLDVIGLGRLADKYLKEKGLISSFSVGKWYSTNDEIFCCTVVGDAVYGFGFNPNGVWVDGFFSGLDNEYGFEEATDVQIVGCLMKRAKQLGYARGVKVASLSTGAEKVLISDEYIYADGKLKARNSTEILAVIFSEGKWAKIVEEISKDEIDREYHIVLEAIKPEIYKQVKLRYGK